MERRTRAAARRAWRRFPGERPSLPRADPSTWRDDRQACRRSDNQRLAFPGVRVRCGSRSLGKGLFQGFFELIFRERGADEKFLSRAGAERDGFPAVHGRHGDPHFHFASRIADRTNDARNDGSDLGVVRKQALQHLADTVDDAVFHFEAVVVRAESHRWWWVVGSRWWVI